MVVSHVFLDEVVTLLKPCWASLSHFSSFSPRSDLSLFMGSPRLQVQFHIKVALTALFLIGWDEGVMTMQVGEVARIQVYSWDVKLAWLPEFVCFTLPAYFICTVTLKCCYSWQFSLLMEVTCSKTKKKHAFILDFRPFAMHFCLIKCQSALLFVFSSSK